MSTKIEWVTNPDGTKGEVWNPVTGCTKVSAGCKNCYAERFAERFWRVRERKDGTFDYDNFRKFTDVRCHTERLEIPLRWKKSRRIFVNSMSDLFHEDVPNDFILRVWIAMTNARGHTFQILTKRPERMNLFVREWLPGAWGLATMSMKLLDVPLPNVWLGVSCEDQKTADERIPLLLQTPAAVRFVSLEPLLGEIDLLGRSFLRYCDASIYKRHLDWVIVGGESGPHARPMHPDWARSIRDQCQEAGVPFFFKQWGEYIFPSQLFYGSSAIGNLVDIESNPASWHQWRVGKKEAGRLLDGRVWNEFPEAR